MSLANSFDDKEEKEKQVKLIYWYSRWSEGDIKEEFEALYDETIPEYLLETPKMSADNKDEAFANWISPENLFVFKIFAINIKLRFLFYI